MRIAELASRVLVDHSPLKNGETSKRSMGVDVFVVEETM
jgi:hypothetical protein